MKTIAEIRKYMFYRMYNAAWYAANKQAMLKRFRTSYFRFRGVSYTDNLKLSHQTVTFFNKLSKKEQQRIIKRAWIGKFYVNPKQVYFSRKCKRIK